MENDYHNRANIEIERLPNKILRIGKMKYAQELFEALQETLPLHETFKIIQRNDEVVTIQRVMIVHLVIGYHDTGFALRGVYSTMEKANTKKEKIKKEYMFVSIEEITIDD